MKYLFWTMIFVLLLSFAWAQDGADTVIDQNESGFLFSLGAGMETNMNSAEGYAVSWALHGEWDFRPEMAAGLRLLYGNDFRTVSNMEILSFFRYYLLDFSGPRDASGLFLQLDLGSALYWASTGFQPFFEFGAAGGYRFGLGDWFLEPYIRGGLPYAWGLGLSAGYRF